MILALITCLSGLACLDWMGLWQSADFPNKEYFLAIRVPNKGPNILTIVTLQENPVVSKYF